MNRKSQQKTYPILRCFTKMPVSFSKPSHDSHLLQGLHFINLADEAIIVSYCLVDLTSERIVIQTNGDILRHVKPKLILSSRPVHSNFIDDMFT